MGVLLLCGAKGTFVEVTARGPTSDEAVRAIGSLIASRFGDQHDWSQGEARKRHDAAREEHPDADLRTAEPPDHPEGIAGSHGLAIGPAVIVGNVSQSFVRRTVKPHEVEVEIGRFSEAVARAQESIRQVVERVKSGHARAETSILDAYVQMLGDELILEGVERNIRINRQNAEWAVSNAIQELSDRFHDMEDPYLVERRHDVAFVGSGSCGPSPGRTRSRR